MTIHRNLTGADLHEPKGIETSLAGQVYVSNGAGSGSWVDAASLITNAAWSTGDVKTTAKTVADVGWVLCNDGTIGDGSSGASTRANADCQALFILLWNNFGANVTVSGGKGASAAADWAAHKTITLPRMAGRAIGTVGSGSGLSTYNLGDIRGEENHILTVNELAPHRHSVFLVDPGHSHGGAIFVSQSNLFLNSGGNAVPTIVNTSAISVATTGISITSGDSVANATLQAGGGNGHNTLQPTIWLTRMIKL